MERKLEIAQAKELRGEIILTLYNLYGEKVSIGTMRNLLRYKNYYSEISVKKAICYLAGVGKSYIHMDEDENDYGDSTLVLTPMGINLAEGDIKDMGVFIDE